MFLLILPKHGYCLNEGNDIMTFGLARNARFA